MISPQKISWKKIFILSWLFSLLSIFATYSYRGYKVFDSLLAAQDDQWCDKKTEAFFSHCFGDFHQGVHPIAALDPPLSKNLSPVLSPMDGYIWKLGNQVYNLFGARPTLALFILLYVCAIAAGCMKLKKIAKQDNWFLLFCFASIPSIHAIYRMNNICLLFPIFVLYLEAVMEQDTRRQTYLVGLIVVFKPQLIVLIGLDLVLKKYKTFSLKLAVSLTAFTAALGVLYGFTFDTYTKYFKSIFMYGSAHVSALDFYPQNLSISHSLSVIYEGLGYITPAQKVAILSTILSLGILILVIFALKENNPFTFLYFIVLFTIHGLSSYTAVYYQLLLNAVVIMILLKSDVIRFRRSLFLALVLSNSAVILPFFDYHFVPLYLSQGNNDNHGLISNITPSISVFIYFLVALGMTPKYSDRKFLTRS